MNQYRYEAHIVPAFVWDEVKIGGQYFGGEVVDGISGMENDLVLVVAFPTVELDRTDAGGWCMKQDRSYG